VADAFLSFVSKVLPASQTPDKPNPNVKTREVAGHVLSVQNHLVDDFTPRKKNVRTHIARCREKTTLEGKEKMYLLLIRRCSRRSV